MIKALYARRGRVRCARIRRIFNDRPPLSAAPSFDRTRGPKGAIVGNGESSVLWTFGDRTRGRRMWVSRTCRVPLAGECPRTREIRPKATRFDDSGGRRRKVGFVDFCVLFLRFGLLYLEMRQRQLHVFSVETLRYDPEENRPDRFGASGEECGFCGPCMGSRP